MKNTQKGFAPIVFLLIITVVAIGGGAYYYSQDQRAQLENIPTENGVSTTTTLSSNTTNAPITSKPVTNKPIDTTPSTSVKIISITPSTGPDGTTITLIGTGFTENGNGIKFSEVGFLCGASSSVVNSETSQRKITFNIGRSITPTCGGGMIYGSMGSLAIGRTYSISVENTNGKSNAVTFNLIASNTGQSVIILQDPTGGETRSIGSQQVIRWIEGYKDVPVSIKLISDSANYRCKKAGGEIYPQDISFIISIADNVPNTGSYNWTVSSSIPTNTTDASGQQYGQYWLQLCQNDKCDISDEVVRLKK